MPKTRLLWRSAPIPKSFLEDEDLLFALAIENAVRVACRSGLPAAIPGNSSARGKNLQSGPHQGTD
jgi:hypothetical protein